MAEVVRMASTRWGTTVGISQLVVRVVFCRAGIGSHVLYVWHPRWHHRATLSRSMDVRCCRMSFRCVVPFSTAFLCSFQFTLYLDS